jgi:hypothetical protein
MKSSIYRPSKGFPGREGRQKLIERLSSLGFRADPKGWDANVRER